MPALTTRGPRIETPNVPPTPGSAARPRSTGKPDGEITAAEIADGRTRRRLNSYERAVDALLDLIESGNEAPTAQQIAERSGISVRTVFRLSEDIGSLHVAAVLRH